MLARAQQGEATSTDPRVAGSLQQSHLLGELSWVEGRPCQADPHIIALAVVSYQVQLPSEGGPRLGMYWGLQQAPQLKPVHAWLGMCMLGSGMQGTQAPRGITSYVQPS